MTGMHDMKTLVSEIEQW